MALDRSDHPGGKQPETGQVVRLDVSYQRSWWMT